MSSFIFKTLSSTEFQVDPVFKCKKFSMYGDIGVFNCPKLFIVNDYRYLLLDPNAIINQPDLVYKLGVYLFHHPHKSNKTPITYIIGDVTKGEITGEDFSNQVVRYVSQEMIIEWFPKSIYEINEKIIQYFLSHQEYYGQTFEWTAYDRNKLLFISDKLDLNAQEESYYFITEQIFQKKLLIKKEVGDDCLRFVLSDLAIDKYQHTLENSNKGKQVFIALKFDGNDDRIKAIQNTVALAGYEPVIMREYQTNNWIMPEIFHQIRVSRFVVVDFSLRCEGAYYEAGYAHALGKEVIQLYDKREKKKKSLHFDVAQKSTVMYDNFDDLQRKLLDRIRATIL